jgi:hypothetical protein
MDPLVDPPRLLRRLAGSIEEVFSIKLNVLLAQSIKIAYYIGRND